MLTKLKTSESSYLRYPTQLDVASSAKFAPNSGGADPYTSSPRLRPVDAKRTPPKRTASVSERIAQRLKEIQKKSVEVIAAAASEDLDGSPDEADEKPTQKLDKGKGRAVEGSASSDEVTSPLVLTPTAERATSPTPPMGPPPMVLAGLSLPQAAVSQLLSRAAAELNLRSVRFPLLGEYSDAFTGEEFVAWLNRNVQGFEGSLDRAEEAARELTEREGLLRRLGELGNQFEDSDDAWYQFRPKVRRCFRLAHTGSYRACRRLTSKASLWTNLPGMKRCSSEPVILSTWLARHWPQTITANLCTFERDTRLRKRTRLTALP